ncbi:sulfite exporter TauE/SafE family protein 3-like [Jatropha curcas]|uniref:sulfite exporter TauE/SafE family protein 3-like n=1 Tax=Jatropha curcas TaxID=180498 RepID=UPI0018945861|nr:sulfite exporter TauE/SafE family protein 3-like [Jatropha curcas]XP_037493458.1 sulfite exporter TauE/SafE family protein 3-like [Jatropha curcas]XP_037493459.1 sulfite exporter TauE/SafE family protein 3-like [Jatropha curcas]XP_037493460.1 sulfite exporter TauE/SafE family protein 3-like [Jatropha curcas]
MAGVRLQWWGLNFRSLGAVFICFLGVASIIVVAETRLNREGLVANESEEVESGFMLRVINFLWQEGQLGYTHVWPDMKFGWRIVVGTIIGFFGAAFGSVGGVGGGGIFVPMLTLIIGFDAKSSTAISKFMITGAAASTVYYNLRLRHPTLDMPIIDYDLALLFQPVLVLGISIGVYDLALLFQPVLVLGISIGVILNVILADWMITVLLIILFIGTSTKTFLKGVETWKKETIIKKEAARRLLSNGDDNDEVEYKLLAGGSSNGAGPESKEKKEEVSLFENVQWRELGVLFAVWVIILALQISKNYTSTCSAAYWVLNILQFPVALGVSVYQAVNFTRTERRLNPRESAGHKFKSYNQLVDSLLLLCEYWLALYCCCGVLAGVVGGLLGLGGGFILGPLFLELGVPAQVSSATATFAMTFSASMSVIEYYLLKRFPVPYALYFVAVSTVAAFVGQHVVRRLISILGRASIIIFILAFTIFVSAISLGGVGIANMVEKIENHQYMGFENLCTYES